jgi:5'-nucleotidase
MVPDMKARRLLLTNDDGIYAPGLVTLANVLHSAGYFLTVVAPDRERSSVGHALTLNRPIRLWEADRGGYSPGIGLFGCDGTPSDCVVLGMEVVDPEAEFVVSGINRGPNLGDDLTYSGTVSAAMEGLILGKGALAVSLNCQRTEPEHHYQTAASVALEILGWLGMNLLPREVLLNINVPNLDRAKLDGYLVTRKGLRTYEGKVTEFRSPHGTLSYWIAGRPEDEMAEGTDVWAVAHGKVSITPIHMDMTHFPSIEMLRSKGLEDLNSGLAES